MLLTHTPCRRSIEYWNARGSEGSLVLMWSGPSIPKQRIPPARLRTPGTPGPSPPPSGPGGCPLAGQISLALTSAVDANSPYATCFARFVVQVDASCALTVVPAGAAEKWSYSAVWSPVAVPTYRQGCPTYPLPGGTLVTERERTAAGVAEAIGGAMAAALFPPRGGGARTYSTLSRAELELDSLLLGTQAPSNTLTFSVVMVRAVALWGVRCGARQGRRLAPWSARLRRIVRAFACPAAGEPGQRGVDRRRRLQRCSVRL